MHVARFPASIPTTSSTTSVPGVGMLAGWRGKDCIDKSRAQSRQLERYIANGCFCATSCRTSTSSIATPQGYLDGRIP